jgi:hypothetical protein
VKVRWLALAAALLACGRIAQSPVCQQYLDCAVAIDPTRSRVLNGEYGHLGTCWATNQSTADTCTFVCARELENLRADGGTLFTACQ